MFNIPIIDVMLLKASSGDNLQLHEHVPANATSHLGCYPTHTRARLGASAVSWQPSLVRPVCDHPTIVSVLPEHSCNSQNIMDLPETLSVTYVNCSALLKKTHRNSTFVYVWE